MNKEWGWTWPLPGNVPWDLRENRYIWIWEDNENRVHNRGMHFSADGGQPVHAVEAGTVIEADLVVKIKGASGFIVYNWVKAHPELKPGVQVAQGELIGTTAPNGLELWIWAEYPGEHLFPHGKCIDPYPFLLPAWCQVTDRFHRDSPPPPADPDEIRDLVRSIQEHALWHYPISISVPPKGVSEDLMEREDGDFKMPDTSDWPKKIRRYGGGMHECLSLNYVYVEPTTETWRGDTGREDHDPRNTAFRVWIEGGGWLDQSQDPDIPAPPEGWTEYNKWISCHDFRLNCGAETMEQALIQLAMKVKFYYEDNGDDRKVPKECDGDFENWGEDDERYVSECEDAGDGFCERCGYLIDAPEIDDEEDETAGS